MSKTNVLGNQNTHTNSFETWMFFFSSIFCKKTAIVVLKLFLCAPTLQNIHFGRLFYRNINATITLQTDLPHIPHNFSRSMHSAALAALLPALPAVLLDAQRLRQRQEQHRVWWRYLSKFQLSAARALIQVEAAKAVDREFLKGK